MRNSLVPMESGAGCDVQNEQLAKSNYRRPTLRESLLSQKAQLVQRMADVDAAIAALDANPNVEEVMNTIQKVT